MNANCINTQDTVLFWCLRWNPMKYTCGTIRSQCGHFLRKTLSDDRSFHDIMHGHIEQFIVFREKLKVSNILTFLF